MPLHFLSTEATLKAFELAQGSYRPRQILELKAQIENETRALEVRVSAGGTVESAETAKIVQMKLRLDNLYALWAEGKLE